MIREVSLLLVTRRAFAFLLHVIQAEDTTLLSLTVVDLYLIEGIGQTCADHSIFFCPRGSIDKDPTVAARLLHAYTMLGFGVEHGHK